MNKLAVHRITNTLGSAAICDQLQVKPHSVRYARHKGYFAAAWYAGLSEMCAEAGIPCPKSAFTFRPRVKNVGNGSGKNKGRVGNSGNSTPSKASKPAALNRVEAE